MISYHTIFKTLGFFLNEIFTIYMIITKGEIFTNIHCSGGSTYLSLLRNETYTKVGEALCLEIRRKDSRNEA